MTKVRDSTHVDPHPQVVPVHGTMPEGISILIMSPQVRTSTEGPTGFLLCWVPSCRLREEARVKCSPQS